MLARLACEHLLGTLRPLILHDSVEVAIRDPASHKGLDVDLVESSFFGVPPGSLARTLPTVVDSEAAT